MMKKLFTAATRLIAVATVAASLTPFAAQAGLIGSNVTGTLYYPDLSTVYDGPYGPYTVSNSVEFPVGTLAFDGRSMSPTLRSFGQPVKMRSTVTARSMASSSTSPARRSRTSRWIAQPR